MEGEERRGEKDKKLKKKKSYKTEISKCKGGNEERRKSNKWIEYREDLRRGLRREKHWSEEKSEDDCKTCIQRRGRASMERRRKANTSSTASGAFNLIRLISVHLHLSHKSCLPLKVITCTEGGTLPNPNCS